MKPEFDPVSRPKHYTSHPSGIEAIEITQHYNFCIGNAIKYLWRNGLKDDEGSGAVKDLKKAIWYINREIQNIEQGVYNGKNETLASHGNLSERGSIIQGRPSSSASGTSSEEYVSVSSSPIDVNAVSINHTGTLSTFGRPDYIGTVCPDRES